MTFALRTNPTPVLSLVPGVTVADIYLRLSDLRLQDLNENGEGKTFRAREEVLRQFAKRLGYTVGLVIVENDEIELDRVIKGKTVRTKVCGASAFKRRKKVLPNGTTVMRVHRPGFHRILNRLDRGESQALIAEDLDRVMRDQYDAEDLLEIVARRKANTRSLSGTGTLTNGGTPDEQFMVRMYVNIAHKSSADTGRRVGAACERTAREGKCHGGGRRFGFEPDGNTRRESECRVIAEASERVLQVDGRTNRNVSLRMIAAELRDAVDAGTGVPTVTGVPWCPRLVRGILLRPRNAGLMVHKGVILEGVKAAWEPIVSREVYDAVVAVLTDKSRRTTPGTAPKYLGTNLYRCGKCTPVGTEPTGTKTMHVRADAHAYQCSVRAHLSYNQESLDSIVVARVLSLLSLPDAATLFVPTSPNVDTDALNAEAEALQVRLDSLVTMYVDSIIDRAQLQSGTEKVRTRLAVIRDELMSAVVDSPLRDLPANGVDVVTWWESLPLANKRLVIDTLVTVTVLAHNPRAKGNVDPTRIVITPKNTKVPS